jgi:hypothetical protein
MSDRDIIRINRAPIVLQCQTVQALPASITASSYSARDCPVVREGAGRDAVERRDRMIERLSPHCTFPCGPLLDRFNDRVILAAPRPLA